MGASKREFTDGREFESKEELDQLYNNAQPNKIDQIEDLLKHALIHPYEQDSILREIRDGIDEERADELIQYLYENRIDPISGGFNYSQNDIKNKLNKEL